MSDLKESKLAFLRQAADRIRARDADAASYLDEAIDMLKKEGAISNSSREQTTAAKRPKHFEYELARVRSAFNQNDGDSEDPITYAVYVATKTDRIEQLEAALRASQAAMKSAFADPDELKFSVKSMDRFAECIANNRVILGDTQ